MCTQCVYVAWNLWTLPPTTFFFSFSFCLPSTHDTRYRTPAQTGTGYTTYLMAHEPEDGPTTPPEPTKPVDVEAGKDGDEAGGAVDHGSDSGDGDRDGTGTDEGVVALKVWGSANGCGLQSHLKGWQLDVILDNSTTIVDKFRFGHGLVPDCRHTGDDYNYCALCDIDRATYEDAVNVLKDDQCFGCMRNQEKKHLRKPRVAGDMTLSIVPGMEDVEGLMMPEEEREEVELRVGFCGDCLEAAKTHGLCVSCLAPFPDQTRRCCATPDDCFFLDEDELREAMAAPGLRYSQFHYESRGRVADDPDGPWAFENYFTHYESDDDLTPGEKEVWIDGARDQYGDSDEEEEGVDEEDVGDDDGASEPQQKRVRVTKD